MGRLKVGIVGLGRIGATLVEDLAAWREHIIYPVSRSKDKVIFVRKDQNRRKKIIADNSLEEILSDTDVTVIAIRNAPKPSKFIERKEYLKLNLPAIMELGNKFRRYQGMVLMVSNPVDECTFAFWEASKLDRGQVIGLNHTDTIRCSRVIQDLYEEMGDIVDLEDITGYYSIGPHNESAFPLISKLRIKGKEAQFVINRYRELREEVSDYAKRQIDGGISTTRTTVDAILDVIDSISEEGKTVTSSAYFGGLFIGLPIQIKERRARVILNPSIDLSKEEIALFKEGYKSILDSLHEAGFSGDVLDDAQLTLSGFEQKEDIRLLPAKEKIEKEEKVISPDSICHLNPYLLCRKLGAGAHGDIYQAEDVITGEIVAVKKSRNIKLLEKEANILKSMFYQNIIGVKDFLVNIDKEGFLVMEYAPRGFAEILEESMEMRLWRVYELFNGVSYIHRNDLIHRDIKPENILLGYRNPPFGGFELKIIDFSLAKSKNANDKGFSGPPGYTAPEAVGSNTTVSSDIYSAGAVAFEILTNAPYYSVKGCSARDIEQRLSKQISRILSKCVEEDVSKRYMSCDEVVRDLKGEYEIWKSIY
ncbi:MAG: protein kinase [Candidatus Nanoarchaeia archaeon]|nr:protein kinase [Candidatus Nanoarchaeia archaeon]